jgi:2-keto-4-pentenoate hydratase/2-oxohepta-3-ene-1,7-dioic acid hydratase in catechol pathway
MCPLATGKKMVVAGNGAEAKTFATFCPLGPVITTLDEIDDPNNLSSSNSSQR